MYYILAIESINKETGRKAPTMVNRLYGTKAEAIRKAYSIDRNDPIWTAHITLTEKQEGRRSAAVILDI